MESNFQNNFLGHLLDDLMVDVLGLARFGIRFVAELAPHLFIHLFEGVGFIRATKHYFQVPVQFLLHFLVLGWEKRVDDFPVD